ncbi:MULTISPECIES: NepR family anti-sigma factor [Actibacterium]|uniref:Putative metal-dependent hydrolase n=1 Tax=Actibacterium naphthalenivorans TaxID=1614693 RepID=A0A840CGW9_9RHOB|nr:MULTISPECIES: NepR family anti-sigma factor [Actibacterium]ALG91981.1 regulator [Actibacterium sp. EMB200-NS6]MBB4023332.1 putative metal-dependent hydrolase [Actibacterium naphthalenivorans]
MAHENNKSRLEEQIDENLRRVYQQKLEEDVPDRFKELLEQLKEQDSHHGKS